jgi:hypothetical protein
LHGINVEIKTSPSPTKCRIVYKSKSHEEAQSRDFREIELFVAHKGVGGVHDFHVAPVRGWFNGTQWYLLPSAVVALKTGISIDFRYAKCAKAATDIIKKYNRRGFRVILNEKEHNHIRTTMTATELRAFVGK